MIVNTSERFQSSYYIIILFKDGFVLKSFARKLQRDFPLRNPGGEYHKSFRLSPQKGEGEGGPLFLRHNQSTASRIKCKSIKRSGQTRVPFTTKQYGGVRERKRERLAIEGEGKRIFEMEYEKANNVRSILIRSLNCNVRFFFLFCVCVGSPPLFLLDLFTGQQKKSPQGGFFFKTNFKKK